MCVSWGRWRPGCGVGEVRPLPVFRGKLWRKAVKSGKEGNYVQ